ncbi:unnamed protein product, partial [Amoebophrya sp. A25]
GVSSKVHRDTNYEDEKLSDSLYGCRVRSTPRREAEKDHIQGSNKNSTTREGIR